MKTMGKKANGMKTVGKKASGMKGMPCPYSVHQASGMKASGIKDNRMQAGE